MLDAAGSLPLGDRDERTSTLLPMVETALQITLDAGPVFGETVVVFGLGVVGLLTIALLQRAGAEVIAVEPQGWRRDVAAALSVTAVDPGDVRDALNAAGRRDGVALVIDASGNPAVLPDALSPPRPRGHCVGGLVVRHARGVAAARRCVPPPATDDPQHPGLDHPGRTFCAVGSEPSPT